MSTVTGGSHRFARSTFRVAALLDFAACGLWIINLAIRPPCYPGYVRLIDLPGVLPEVSGFVGLVSVTGFLVKRKRAWKGRGTFAVVVAGVMLVLALVLAVGGIGAVASDQGPYDNSCWTF